MSAKTLLDTEKLQLGTDFIPAIDARWCAKRDYARLGSLCSLERLLMLTWKEGAVRTLRSLVYLHTLPTHQLWSTIAHDDDACAMIESVFEHLPRTVDGTYISATLHSSDDSTLRKLTRTLARFALQLLFRIGNREDATTIISPQLHRTIARRVLTLENLLHVCAVYWPSNKELVSALVHTSFAGVGVLDELYEQMPAILDEMSNSCTTTIKRMATTDTCRLGTTQHQNEMLVYDVFAVVSFTVDTLHTLTCTVNTVPRLARVFMQSGALLKYIWAYDIDYSVARDLDEYAPEEKVDTQQREYILAALQDRHDTLAAGAMHTLRDRNWLQTYDFERGRLHSKQAAVADMVVAAVGDAFSRHFIHVCCPCCLCTLYLQFVVYVHMDRLRSATVKSSAGGDTMSRVEHLSTKLIEMLLDARSSLGQELRMCTRASAHVLRPLDASGDASASADPQPSLRTLGASLGSMGIATGVSMRKRVDESISDSDATLTRSNAGDQTSIVTHTKEDLTLTQKDETVGEEDGEKTQMSTMSSIKHGKKHGGGLMPIRYELNRDRVDGGKRDEASGLSNVYSRYQYETRIDEPMDQMDFDLMYDDEYDDAYDDGTLDGVDGPSGERAQTPPPVTTVPQHRQPPSLMAVPVGSFVKKGARVEPLLTPQAVRPLNRMLSPSSSADESPIEPPVPVHNGVKVVNPIADHRGGGDYTGGRTRHDRDRNRGVEVKHDRKKQAEAKMKKGMYPT